MHVTREENEPCVEESVVREIRLTSRDIDIKVIGEIPGESPAKAKEFIKSVERKYVNANFTYFPRKISESHQLWTRVKLYPMIKT